MTALDPVREIRAATQQIVAPPRSRSEEIAASVAERDSNIAAAAKYSELAQRARGELRRRVDGIRFLFGPEAAESLVRALEEVEECYSEADYHHGQALHEAERIHQVLHAAAVESNRQLRADVSRYRVALAGAAEAEQLRHKRTPAARRKLAPWFADAVAGGLLEEAPF